MFSRKKGEYGYIKKAKKQDIIKMLIYVAIALLIFFVGLLMNKMSYTNVFTVVAILFVLPWARVLVEYIVLFTYHTPEKEDYDKVVAAVSPEAKVISDYVFTSTERSMGLNFLVVGNGYAYGWIMNDKQDVKGIQTYLQKGVSNWSDQYQVKIYTRLEELLKVVSHAKEKEIPDQEREKVESYLLSLAV